MNELDRKRLAKAKPEISASLVEELSRRIDAFQEFGQYQVLSGVHLAQFFSDPEGVPESLKQKTVEDIVTAGALVLSLEPEVTTEHLSELLVILTRFTPEREEAPDHSSKNASPEGPSLLREVGVGNGEGRAQARGSQHTDVPILSSVEAERQLVDRYNQLRNSPHFEEVKYKKIADYWDSSIINAPFLEELSFREILEISVDHLLKKRSVGNTKIYCLVKAFDALFEEIEARVEPEERASSLRALPEKALSVPSPKWGAVDESYSPTAKALLSQWEYLRQRLYHAEIKKGLLRALFVRLPDLISKEEFIALWFAAENTLETASTVLGAAHEELQDFLKAGTSKLLELLEKEAAEDLQWVKTAVQGLGTSEDALSYPLRIPNVSEQEVTMCLRLVLLAIGASQPVFEGEPLTGFWTLKPGGLEKVLSKVSSAASEEEQRELLQTLAPQFPTDVLLKTVAKAKSS